MYIAQYDHDAKDDDEVSFTKFDRIIDAELIDQGWMFGTVEKTGKRGMIPGNYVALHTSTERKFP